MGCKRDCDRGGAEKDEVYQGLDNAENVFVFHVSYSRT